MRYTTFWAIAKTYDRSAIAELFINYFLGHQTSCAGERGSSFCSPSVHYTNCIGTGFPLNIFVRHSILSMHVLLAERYIGRRPNRDLLDLRTLIVLAHEVTLS
jgi:hypothetical protein